MAEQYLVPGPSRSEVDLSVGPVLLEFGTGWCGHCQAAAAVVSEAISQFPKVQHIRVEDGPGRRLGRTFRVKLWPTLIFLKDGVEISRVVRPQNADVIRSGLGRIS